MDTYISTLATTAPPIRVNILDAGWVEPEIIIGIASSLLTLIALVVAIRSNITAKKSLRDALKMQEQGKNVELYEKRATVLDQITSVTLPDYQRLLTNIELLFDKNILDQANVLLQELRSLQDAESDMSDYKSLSCSLQNIIGDRFDEMSEEAKAERNACVYDDDATNQAFIEVCKKHALLYTPLPDEIEPKWYNYAEISRRIYASQRIVESERQALYSMAKEWIKKSIAEIK